MQPATERAAGFLDRATRALRILRWEAREKRLALVGFLLLAAAGVLRAPLPLEGLPEEIASFLPWVSLVLLLAGLACLVLAFHRIWRKVVAPAGEDRPVLPAIKGPASFGPQDAELFARLGRGDDLARLRGWLLDDQKPLVAVMGESGVGKTSLLRAGLAHVLKGDGLPVIYWEAVPTDPEGGLLHAARTSWGDPETAPQSFEDLAGAVLASGRVVVIDQLEQLLPERHPRIFELLHSVVVAKPPHRGAWVVAFRREYAATWKDFELGLPDRERLRIETLSLRSFPVEEARRVVAVLAEEARLPVEQGVIGEVVAGISEEGRVSPVDVGISLLVLSELAGRETASLFSAEDLKTSGGPAGLLTRYLERLLEELPREEREEVFRALLTLVDPERDQRIAEGRSLEELAAAGRPASRKHFESHLRMLASAKARILEELRGAEGESRWRLTHERLIPPLRRLTGKLLAEVDEAGLILERAFRAWSGDRRSRYLLAGADLQRVLRFQEQFAWGAEASAKRDFLRQSRRRRTLVYGSVGVGLSVILALGLLGLQRIKDERTADRLEGWGLPRDLHHRLDQLEVLRLSADVNSVDWLAAAPRLRSLDLRGSQVRTLKGLPKTLEELDIRNVPLEGWGFLPERLRELRVAIRSDYVLATRGLLGNFFEYRDWLPLKLPQGLHLLESTLSELEEGDRLPLDLRTLIVRDASLEEVLELLPAGLRVLRVNYAGGSALKKLPPNLEVLLLEEVIVDRFTDLPRSVRVLDLGVAPAAVSLEGVPEGLKSLGLEELLSRRTGDLPDSLETLRIRENYVEPLTGGQAEVRGEVLHLRLPASVRSLDLSGLDYLHFEGLPVGLETLKVGTVSNLAMFPPGLRSLVVGDLSIQQVSPDFSEWKNFPGALERLSILQFSARSNLQLHLVNLPPRLRRLDVSMVPRIVVQELPPGLEVLCVAGSAFWSFDGLPGGLDTFDISGTPIDSLEGLPFKMKRLAIHRTRIRSLEGLPEGLEELTLSPGQVETLEHLPKSVRRLAFIDDPTTCETGPFWEPLFPEFEDF